MNEWALKNENLHTNVFIFLIVHIEPEKYVFPQCIVDIITQLPGELRKIRLFYTWYHI